MEGMEETEDANIWTTAPCPKSRLGQIRLASDKEPAAITNRFQASEGRSQKG